LVDEILVYLDLRKRSDRYRRNRRQQHPASEPLEHHAPRCKRNRTITSGVLKINFRNVFSRSAAEITHYASAQHATEIPNLYAHGSLLHVGVGSNANITKNAMQAEENRAAEVDRASGRWRIFATGLRNPKGLSWEPQTGALWTVVNERDETRSQSGARLFDIREKEAFTSQARAYAYKGADPHVYKLIETLSKR
jgi:hypothetical protein